MFSAVFIDISLIFVQLGLENFGKIVRDPPFYYLCKSSTFYTNSLIVFVLIQLSVVVTTSLDVLRLLRYFCKVFSVVDTKFEPFLIDKNLNLKSPVKVTIFDRSLWTGQPMAQFF